MRTGAARGSAKSRRATAAKRSQVSTNQLSYFVLVPTVLLLCLGLVMVFSAGSVLGLTPGGSAYRVFIQQVAWAVLGLGLMIFFSRFDYHKLGKISWVGVIASIVMLCAVLAIGTVVGGARRWISVGPLNIQPTEIAKFTAVIFAAYVLAMKGDRLKKFSQLAIPVLLLVAIEGGLILMQPDLGSALVLAFSVLLVAGLSQARPRHIAAVCATGGTAAVVAMVAAPYRRARLFSFINPWKSPRGYGYHVIQSYIALGTGHIKGVGIGMSTQKFLYLPNAHTDFIFAIIGEELGLVGTMTVVVLVGVLAVGGFLIARHAKDDLGRLLAAGIVGLIVIQALVNMGGVVGLLPITGVPLPLVSAGGSSLCICMGCIGILLNIATQSKDGRARQ
jgi:cell division protein FtsW